MKLRALLAVLISSAPLFAQSPPSVWPQIIGTSAGTVTIYQPQVDSFSQNVLTAHAAVSIVPTGQTNPVFGAVWVKSTVQTDRDARTIDLLSTSVTDSRFPQADAGEVAAVTLAITQKASDFTISLDAVLASLAKTQKTSPSAEFNNTPPQIIYSDEPAVLVTIDGEPEMQAVSGFDLMRVVNTPFFIVLDTPSKTYYLRGPGTWLSASNVMGPWQSALNPPPSVTSFFAQTKTAQEAGSLGQATDLMPKIIVATQPTELIQTDGAADFMAIPGTNLLYVSNTQSDVFMDIDTQALFVLLSGRWYTAASKAGPWTFVPPENLPPDFAKIPESSPKANVLASVAGSTLADNAVADASVPQTAAIPRNSPGPDVKYDGDPNFQAIPQTSLQYAVNTSNAVVNMDGTYYCCSEGVWYMGSSPNGPWVVAASVPKAIYSIPPSCPIYNVTYCYVYDNTPDVIYCGYLPGYLGSYVWGGTVVYGTGWPYRAWYGAVYIPRPATWGFAAVFNPVTCGWGFAVGGGWGGAVFAGGRSGWWGVGGWAHNTWTGGGTVNVNRNVTVNNTNIYNRNVNRTVNRNTVNRVNVDHRTVNNTDINRVRNDVYAGNDGNVYKHSLDGWQQHSNGSWKSVNDFDTRDTFHNNVQPQLNRDFSARSSGGFSGGFRGGGGGRR